MGASGHGCQWLWVPVAMGASTSSQPPGQPHSIWERAQPLPSVPGFTEGVANQTVVVGRDGALRCSVENLGNYKIAWMKSDTQTLLSISNTMISRNYRIRVSHSDNSTWFLHLDTVILADRGYYLCQINTVPPISRQGYLEVVVPPNILDEETSTDVEVQEDDQAVLRCGAEGYPAPEIRFKREDGVGIRYAANGISGAVASSVTESLGGVEKTVGLLSFETVTRADMGHYLCIANNSVPPSVSKRMVLNVRYREPAVYVSHQMIGVYRGDDVAINCTVTAYPRPVVFWQDSMGKMIISGGRYQVVESQLGESPPKLQTTLIIRGLRVEDITTYRCNASIDNDKTREKSLAVQLNESSYSQDIYYKVARHPKNLQKSLTKQNHNEIGDRYQKPTNFIPGNLQDIFLHPSLGHVNYDETSNASRSSHSHTSIRLVFALIGLWSFPLVVWGRT
ncbi:lachesin-like [Homarus americanus]|uniref:lachesin-like n=1 Tax=Homarus americanus TaxID=6706 RepID=UPI001C48CD66|nr:lachesin-like [Homarus americanus]